MNGETAPPGRLLGLCLGLVGCFGRLVPRAARADWEQEWQAELVYRWLCLQRARSLDGRRQLELVGRSFGAFPHALWMLAQEWRWDMLMQDLRYAVRSLRGSPGFTVIAVLILGLGIGGIAGSFSVADTFLLRPLPYTDPERLVHLYELDHQSGSSQGRFSFPAVHELVDSTSLFEDVGLYHYQGRNGSGGEGDPEHLMVSYLTPNLLPILGVEPPLGRGFTAEEGRPGAAHVALIGHRVWQSRFGGAGDVVGRTLQLDGVTHTVIGVMPRGFQFPFGEVRVWTTIQASASGDWGEYSWDYDNLQPVARLAPGVSRAQAASVLDGRYRQILGARGEASDYGVAVVPLRQALLFMYDMVRLLCILIVCANACVLLIICANIANLMISRSTGRTRETAIRSVLGAGRGRLIRQLLTEGLVLALVGAVVGLVLAYWQTRSTDALIPEALFRTGTLGLDWRALGVTLLVSAVSTFFFALLPALQSTSLALVDGLKEGSGTTGGLRGSHLRRALVVVQVSLALMLLVGASLLIQTVLRLERVDPGFDPNGLLTMNLRLTSAEYPDLDQVGTVHEQLEERIESLPGVVSAAFVQPLPMNFASQSKVFEVEGRVPAAADERLVARSHWVSPAYAETMKMTLLEGRDIEPRDRQSAPGVVLVNRTLAQRFWPQESAVGNRLRWSAEEPEDWLTVVGVVADSKSFFLSEEQGPTLFIPMRQSPWRESFLVARTVGRPQDAFGGIREAIWQVVPELPLAEVRTMNEVLENSTVIWRGARGGLLGVAAVALVLASLGIYGVVSFAVSRRTHEIGIRRALGADRAAVLRLVMGQGVTLTLVGLALGLAGAVALTHFLSGLLFGVEALDPATFGAASLVLLLVAVTATLVPARRAVRIDPVRALRHE